MAIKSKAPLPSTFAAVEAEVFQSRTKDPGTSGLRDWAAEALPLNKTERNQAAAELAAMCIRAIEEVE